MYYVYTYNIYAYVHIQIHLWDRYDNMIEIYDNMMYIYDNTKFIWKSEYIVSNYPLDCQKKNQYTTVHPQLSKNIVSDCPTNTDNVTFQ